MISPGMVALKMFLAMANGATVFLTMVFTQQMIDSIALESSHTYFYTVLLGAVLLVAAICPVIERYLDIQIANQTELVLGGAIIKKCGEISYQNYEMADTYRIIDNITKRYKEVSIGIINNVSLCVKLAIALFGILYYLIMVKCWIFPAVLITVVPVLALTVYASMKEYDSFSQYYPYLRKAQYLSALITGRRNVKEARLFQYRSMVEKMWEVSLRKFQTEQIRANIGPPGFWLVSALCCNTELRYLIYLSYFHPFRQVISVLEFFLRLLRQCGAL